MNLKTLIIIISNTNDNKEDKANKNDSVTEIQVSNLEMSTKLEYNDSSG